MCRVLPARRWQDQLQLPLAEYGLSPGDEIKLFARVEDNDPAGGKGAESTVATVRIISQKDFEQLLQMRAGNGSVALQVPGRSAAIGAVAGAAPGTATGTGGRRSGGPGDGPAARKTAAVGCTDSEQAAAINESADHPLPYDVDQNLTEQLRRVGKQLNDAATALESAASTAGPPNRQLADALQKLAQQLDQNRQQFQQQAMQPLEHLAQIYPLMEDESRFVTLVLQQRDLSERLAAVKDSDKQDDPAVQAACADLEEEQRALREELADLLNDIEDHVSQLPDDASLDKLRQTATDFVAAVRDSGAAEAMSNAEMALAEFAGKRGYEEAKRAADILEGLLKKCDGMGGACQGCLAFQPTLSNCLGNTVQQLLAQAGFGSGAGGGQGKAWGAATAHVAEDRVMSDSTAGCRG